MLFTHTWTDQECCRPSALFTCGVKIPMMNDERHAGSTWVREGWGTAYLSAVCKLGGTASAIGTLNSFSTKKRVGLGMDKGRC